MQLTDSQVASYRAALDDVRAEISALAGTGIRAHDAAIDDVLELVAKLKFRDHKSRDHAAVAPQRGVKAPAVGVPPNDAAGATWGAVFDRHKRAGCDPSDAAFRADQWEKNRKRHLETIRRYSLGLTTRG
jgi:hypothetical protein